MRALFLLPLLLGCATSGQLSALQARVGALEEVAGLGPKYDEATYSRLGGPEASEPIASIGAWVPVQASRALLTGVGGPGLARGVSGVTLDTTQTITGAKTFSAATGIDVVKVRNSANTGAGLTFNVNDTTVRAAQAGASVYLSDNTVNFARFQASQALLDTTGGTCVGNGTGGDCDGDAYAGAYGFATSAGGSQGMSRSGGLLLLNVAAGQSIYLRNASGLTFTKANADGLQLPGVATGSLTACAAGLEGTLQYDTTLHKMDVCDGTNWVALH